MTGSISLERARDLYAWAYAWRATDGEDETDLSVVRERQAAEFDAMIGAVQREAQVSVLRTFADNLEARIIPLLDGETRELMAVTTADLREFADQIEQGTAAREWVNPDCLDGKHRACAGDAWNLHSDEPTRCECDMAVESELAAGLMAKMHADEAHPEPHSHGRADV